MGLQVWPTEAIANILYAIQNLMQVTATVPNDDEHPGAYHQGFQRGVEAGFQRVVQSFNRTPSSLKIWTHEHVQNILNSAQVRMPDDLGRVKVKTCSADCKWGFNQGLETSLWCLATSFGVSLWPAENGAGARDMVLPKLVSWFRDDIQNILAGMKAVVDAKIAPPESTARQPEFERGFEDGLRIAAQSFGIRLLLPANTSLSEGAVQFWLRQDIHKKLATAYQSFQAPPTAYQQGFQTAVRCIARAFGVRL